MIFRRAIVVALAVGTIVTPAAHADTCADDGGVTVVVDYRALGAGVRTGCARGGQASGLSALSGAGFGYTFPTRQPGFVCRINNLPGADREACVSTPPASAYWSYWHAEPGGSWSYSSLGAGSYVPPTGSVEGWAFGSGEQPGIGPPQRPAPAQPPPVQPQPPVVHPPPAVPSTTSGETTTSAPSTSSSAAPVGSSSPVTASSSARPPIPEASPPVEVEPVGSGTGLVITILLIAVLGGVAWWTARRRSRTEE